MRPVVLEEGDRIAQISFGPVWAGGSLAEVEASEFDETDRGDQGFGSTGLTD